MARAGWVEDAAACVSRPLWDVRLTVSRSVPEVPYLVVSFSGSRIAVHTYAAARFKATGRAGETERTGWSTEYSSGNLVQSKTPWQDLSLQPKYFRQASGQVSSRLSLPRLWRVRVHQARPSGPPGHTNPDVAPTRHSGPVPPSRPMQRPSSHREGAPGHMGVQVPIMTGDRALSIGPGRGPSGKRRRRDRAIEAVRRVPGFSLASPLFPQPSNFLRPKLAGGSL